MRELIYTVHDWEVIEEDNGFIIRNSTHVEWNNYFYKARKVYRYNFKRVPISIDRVIKNRMGMEEGASDRTFGVEIECLHRTNSRVREEVARALENIGIECYVEGYNHRVSSNWKIVTDSSIDEGTGLEVVSPILKGQEGIDQVKKVMKVLSEHGCCVNRSTGMHVHIGANDLSTSQLHTVFSFYKENEDLFDSLVANSRRRDHNSYCHSLVGHMDFPSSRYFKVNYQAYLKYGTVEFRQHQGTLNGDKAEHWIKLVRAVVDYSKTHSVSRYTNIESMVQSLGLRREVNWYSERAEELAS